ncbi:MAG: oxalate/formate MFS antiporter [Burkholderiaceae bacterium]
MQLFIGVVSMACVANLQYGWTLFVNPIDQKYHFGRAAIQVAFTVFVVIETWLVPVEGYLVDRFGPRSVVLGGAVLVAASWLINSVADSLSFFYVGAALGGIGTGAVYGTCVGNALKWFPYRRGLAAGVTAAGFGAGAAISVIPIGNMIASSGYERAFSFFGVLQGAIVFVMAWGLCKAPVHLNAVRSRANQTARHYRPTEVLRTPVFWLMYLMFILVASGGLMFAASVVPVAEDFGIDAVVVSLFGVALPAGRYALSVDRILDGVGRPFFGWLSDRIGRENTMGIAFFAGALALFILSQFGSHPIVFVLVSGLYFLVFGEIYSLFPATQGDTFGSKYAASNAGLLYTAKGTASLLVPLATALAKADGWHLVFGIAMAFNITAGSLALFLLKPMRARHVAASHAPPSLVVEAPSRDLASSVGQDH